MEIKKVSTYQIELTEIQLENLRRVLEYYNTKVSSNHFCIDLLKAISVTK